nr:MAG TPA: hypothetical protein [Caudoviricetes sp.]
MRAFYFLFVYLEKICAFLFSKKVWQIFVQENKTYKMVARRRPLSQSVGGNSR